MKKLLLLLLLSLAFICSANANSIKGAFGYKLGQVVKDAKTEEFITLQKGSPPLVAIVSSKEFIPKKPLPGNHTYTIYTTLEDKKIYNTPQSTDHNVI